MGKRRSCETSFLGYRFGCCMITDQSSQLRLTDTLVLEELDEHVLRSARTESFRQEVVRCCSTGILSANNLDTC